MNTMFQAVGFIVLLLLYELQEKLVKM